MIVLYLILDEVPLMEQGVDWMSVSSSGLRRFTRGPELGAEGRQ